jgi:hypothetical protein
VTDHVPITTHDHSELFSDHPLRGGFTPQAEDPFIRNGEQYGAACTARRHLRAAVHAMAATNGATDSDRQAVWRVHHALATRIGEYERRNNLPPAEVTP